MKEIFTAVLALALAGCTSSHIIVGKQRPPISPDQVQVYLDPPPVYEKVAILESNNTASFALTSQQKTNKVMQRLRQEAASLGANGILFQGMQNQYTGSVGTGQAWGYGRHAYGIGTSVATTMKVGSGIAIYVPDLQVNDRVNPVDFAPRAGDSNTPMLPAEQRPTVPATPPSSPRYEMDPAKRCESCSRIGLP